MKNVPDFKEKPVKKSNSFFLIYLKAKSFLIFLFLLTACGKNIPESGFDSAAWKADPGACKNQRAAQLPELQKLRDNLPGVSDKDIQEFFGPPEATMLSDKSEHIYVYYIEPGSHCQNQKNLSESNKLLVTVNGLSLVTEVRFENPVRQ
jgi:hypothetical protein